MASRTDLSRVDFIVNTALPATGTVLLGNDTQGGLATATTNLVAPFSVQSLLGYNHISFTFYTTSGSTAVGTISFQVTDFGGLAPNDVFGIPSTSWATLASPTVSVLTGANAYNVNISNTAYKFIRCSYAATSGTGNIYAAITLRANSRD